MKPEEITKLREALAKYKDGPAVKVTIAKSDLVDILDHIGSQREEIHRLRTIGLELDVKVSRVKEWRRRWIKIARKLKKQRDVACSDYADVVKRPRARK